MRVSFALGERCSHHGCPLHGYPLHGYPLHEGNLDGDTGQPSGR